MLQAAGIDVYAQEPAQTVSRDSVIVREAPKARARRHRELPPQSTDSLKDTHSLISRDSITAIRLDSMEMHAIAPAIADSLDKVNKQNLKEMETSITPQLPRTVCHQPFRKKYGHLILQKRRGWPLYSPVADRFTIVNSGSSPSFTEDLPVVRTLLAGMGKCTRTTPGLI